MGRSPWGPEVHLSGPGDSHGALAAIRVTADKASDEFLNLMVNLVQQAQGLGPERHLAGVATLDRQELRALGRLRWGSPHLGAGSGRWAWDYEPRKSGLQRLVALGLVGAPDPSAAATGGLVITREGLAYLRLRRQAQLALLGSLLLPMSQSRQEVMAAAIACLAVSTTAALPISLDIPSASSGPWHETP